MFASLPVPVELDITQAATLLEIAVDRLLDDRDTQRARAALLSECAGSPVLGDALTDMSPARPVLSEKLSQILCAAGKVCDDTTVYDFLGMLDSLVVYLSADVSGMDVRAVAATYLRGLEDRERFQKLADVTDIRKNA